MNFISKKFKVKSAIGPWYHGSCITMSGKPSILSERIRCVGAICCKKVIEQTDDCEQSMILGGIIDAKFTLLNEIVAHVQILT